MPSGEGFFYSPEDQASLQANQRRQAYAQALMEQGQNSPTGQYGGLRSAGNSILGAFLSKRADDKQTELSKSAQDKYVQSMAALLRGQPAQPQTPAGPPQMDPEGNVMAPGQGTPGYQAQPQQTPQGQPGGDFMSRLLATGNAGLIQQYAPKIIDSRLEMENKHLTPLSPQQAQAMGLRGTWGLDAAGNPVKIQDSDVKSQDAEDQQIRMDRAKGLKSPEEMAQAIQLAREGKSNPNNVQSVQPLSDGTLLIISRDGTPKHVTMDGKPVMGARYDPVNKFNMSAAASSGTAAGKTAESLPTVDATFAQINRNLDAFDRPDIKAQADRSLGFFDSKLPAVGGYNSEFKNRLAQMEGQTFLQAFNSLRGAGAITEPEGQKATVALTRMQRATTAKEFYEAKAEAKQTFSEINAAVRQRAMRGSVVPQMGGGQQPVGQTAPPAPSGNNDPLGLRR